MQAASPATPEEDRNKLYSDAVRLDNLGYDQAAISSVVNASMKSAVPGFQERSPAPYEQSESLPLDNHGIPVVKPEEAEALRTAMKIRHYSLDLRGDLRLDSIREGSAGASLENALKGIPHEDQQVILAQMLTRIEEMHPEVGKQTLAR